MTAASATGDAGEAGGRGAGPGGGALGLDDVVAFVRAHGDAVLATRGPDGLPQAAYLTLAATDEGGLVLDARVTSRKVANLRRDPWVALVVGGRGGVTLQCEGVAELPQGRERARCAGVYASAFPQFAGSLDDPGIVVVHVRLAWARLGDYRCAPPVLRELRRAP